MAAHDEDRPNATTETPETGFGLLDASRSTTGSGCPRILALDLSLTCSGFCVDGRSGVIRVKTRGMERLRDIRSATLDLISVADVLVLEGYSFGSQGRAVYQIGELGGVIRFEAFVLGTPVVEIPPSTLKKYATGRGNAPKDAMIAAAIQRFAFHGSDNNEADAYMLWAMARHAYGHPIARVPQAQSAQVAKVEWPVLEGKA